MTGILGGIMLMVSMQRVIELISAREYGFSILFWTLIAGIGFELLIKAMVHYELDKRSL